MEDCYFEEMPSADGKLGLITLNRPRALNALTHAMCVAMYQQLDRWSHQADLKAVIIQGEGDKAFCAGGDIRYVYELGPTQADKAARFFQDEYRLNRQLHHYPKPVLALLDGITMGGGVGISIHGSHQIATERLLLAMPETAIGFFPDVGTTYVLARCPDYFGFYLALTGTRINAAEAQMLGLVTHCIDARDQPALIQALIEVPLTDNSHHVVNQVLANFKASVQLASTLPAADVIRTIFNQRSIEALLSGLKKHQASWAQEGLARLKRYSPTSLKISLEQLHRAQALNFDDCIAQELQLAQRFLQDHDFYEGIRAILIDKDQQPHWQPASLSGVDDETVLRYFTPQTGDL